MLKHSHRILAQISAEIHFQTDSELLFFHNKNILSVQWWGTGNFYNHNTVNNSAEEIKWNLKEWNSIFKLTQNKLSDKKKCLKVYIVLQIQPMNMWPESVYGN